MIIDIGLYTYCLYCIALRAKMVSLCLPTLGFGLDSLSKNEDEFYIIDIISVDVFLT